MQLTRFRYNAFVCMQVCMLHTCHQMPHVIAAVMWRGDSQNRRPRATRPADSHVSLAKNRTSLICGWACGWVCEQATARRAAIKSTGLRITCALKAL